MDVDSEEKEKKEATSDVRYYVGHKQLAIPKDNMKIESPFENGVIKIWDHIERLIDHAYTGRLGIKSEDHPILMTEVPYQSRQNREQMVTMLFETFKAPAVFLAKNPVLSAFAHGKYTALVIDSGAYGTTVTPVHDGYALTRGIVRNSYAGYSIDKYVQQVLEKCRRESVKPPYMYTRTKVGTAKFATNNLPSEQFANIDPSYHEYAIRNVLNDAKEHLFRTSEIPFDENKNRSLPTLQYEMADGVMIDVGMERFTVPETLFRPSAIVEQANHIFTEATGSDQSQQQEMANDALFGETLNNVHALQQLAYESIMRCDADIRKDLFMNTILSGGNTMFPDLAKRFERELQAKAPSNVKVKPPISAQALTTEKKYSTWIGGSILASLGSFQQMWISRAEYDEHGAVIVHKKCP
jgi:actin-like protein 6A